MSERAWGTVREDYSDDRDAGSHFPHDHARSRIYLDSTPTHPWMRHHHHPHRPFPKLTLAQVADDLGGAGSSGSS